MSIRTWALACLIGPCQLASPAQDTAKVVFLEPVGAVDTRGAEIAETMPLYRRAGDPSRYTAWLNNESARRALQLYRVACQIAQPAGGAPDYFIALVEGGNHAAVGFRLQTTGGVEQHPRDPYILLDPEPSRFETTLLHETGHMAMALVAGGRTLSAKTMAAIPHSTAALSDRATAFSEGYAIHLETLQAHVSRDPANRQRYDHEQVLFAGAPYRVDEYFRQAADLTSYSQNLARYTEVRDNVFSFESAFQGADYLRVQLEKARDFSTVRDANQLLQSEGFYASFFFLLMVRGPSLPTEDTIAERERQVLEAMGGMFRAETGEDNQPWLLKFATEYMKQFPDRRTEVVDALNDLSHGVFVDAGAPALWKDHYLAALRLDAAKLNIAGITALRKRWREQVLANPDLLYSRLGPEIRCVVPDSKVQLVALQTNAAVQFDLNTVQPGILRLIPGIAETGVSAWLAERGKKPFTSPDDFRSRGFLRPQTLAALKFE